jgi:arabinogalactan oligomer/maltooligosaccharide transport system substrate-binding protein
VVWTAELADLGYISPVDEWLTTEDRADFLDATLATTMFKDETWGLPQVTDCLALVVNRRIFETAKVPVPTTMEELEKAALALQDKASGRWGFAYPANESYFVLPYIWAFGGDLVNAERREVLLDSPGSVAGLEFVLGLRKRGAVSAKFDVANDYNNQLEDFKSGKLAAFFMGPWATASILSGTAFKDTPGNLGIHPIPSGPGGTRNSPIGGHTWTIGARSAHPEIAFLLIHHLTSTKEQIQLTVKNNLLPTRKSAYDTPEVKSNRVALAFREALNSARPRPVLPETASLIPALTPAFQDALRGDKTAKEAMESVAAQWRQQLKR